MRRRASRPYMVSPTLPSTGAPVLWEFGATWVRFSSKSNDHFWAARKPRSDLEVKNDLEVDKICFACFCLGGVTHFLTFELGGFGW